MSRDHNTSNRLPSQYDQMIRQFRIATIFLSILAPRASDFPVRFWETIWCILSLGGSFHHFVISPRNVGQRSLPQHR
jgi:hypothetical protein